MLFPFLGSEWYFSWGYSRDFWQPSDIHISQPALGNDFTIHQVQAQDFPQWNTGLANKDLTDPQYNIRIGHFFDADRSLGVEFNFDHSKYSSILDQTSHITGTMGGQPVDMYQQLTTNYFHYDLHNGANHIMLNVVKRFPIVGEINRTFSVAALAKAGAGIMLPHAENTVLGNNNNVGAKQFNNWVGLRNGWWQLNGWTTGIEAGFRFVAYDPVYLELTDKEAFAKLEGVPVYEGTASQELWMNEIILSVGFTLSDS